MRVEIDVSDEEAAELLRLYFHKQPDGPPIPPGHRILGRLARALPRPIAVGDKVRYPQADSRPAYEVVALDGGHAWLRNGINNYTTALVGLLLAVSDTGEPT
jgi:hypothetical protein